MDQAWRTKMVDPFTIVKIVKNHNPTQGVYQKHHQRNGLTSEHDYLTNLAKLAPCETPPFLMLD